ncbi:MAG TPA: hypothetical protein DDY13_10580 [Cytophagales bacterium]|nr:hypothetical protein [Cytophagales bacterium]
MGIIIKQSVRNSIYIYAGALLGFVTVAILFPRFLDPGQIGTLSLLVSFSMISGRLGTLGLNSSIYRFFPKFRHLGKDNAWPFLIIITGFIGFTLFLIFYFLFGNIVIENNLDKSPDFAKYFYLIIPLTLFQIFFFNLDALNSVLYNSTLGTFIKEFLQRVLILAGFLFIVFGIFDFEQYIFWYVSSICFGTLVLLVFLIKQGNFNWRPKQAIHFKPEWKNIFSVSGFGLLNGFSGFAVLQFDRILVNAFLNSAATGIYSITFYFGILISMPARGLQKIASTLISDAYASNDYDKVDEIYQKSCLNQFIFGMWALLGIWVNQDAIFHILPAEYREGRYVILFIGIAQLIKMAGGLNDAIIMYSKYFKVVTLFQVVFLILTTGLNVILIPEYGLSGAAFASLLAISIHLVMKWIFIWLKFGFQPYNLKFLLVLFLGLATYFITDIFPESGNWLFDLFVRSVLVTLLFLGSIYTLKLSNDINGTIIGIYRKFKNLQ